VASRPYTALYGRAFSLKALFNVSALILSFLSTSWKLHLTMLGHLRYETYDHSPFHSSPPLILHPKANSKLANILHNKELQRRFDKDGIPITCSSVHPGAVKTIGFDGMVDSWPYVLRLIINCITPLVLSSWQEGAMTSAFAAASKQVRVEREGYKGVYLTPTAKITKPSSYAADERLATELYQTTVEVLKELNVL